MKHKPYSWESTLRKLFYMNEKTIIVKCLTISYKIIQIRGKYVIPTW